MNTQILVYGLREGETERYTEDLLSENCQSDQDVEKIKQAASKDGYHSFRVTTYNLSSPPDFTKVFNQKKIN